MMGAVREHKRQGNLRWALVALNHHGGTMPAVLTWMSEDKPPLKEQRINRERFGC